jgi:hypothetical protein
MKKFISATILLIGLLSVSCNLFTPQVEGELNTIEFKVESFTSKGTSADLSSVGSMRARVFYSSTDENNGIRVNNTEVTLELKNDPSTGDYWHGLFDYDPATVIAGTNVYIHVMAFDTSDGTGEIKYQGNSLNPGNITSLNGEIIPLIEGYAVGDRGPGGGWVIYDKESFSDDSKMRKFNNVGVNPATDSEAVTDPVYKAWRYIELAPQDLKGDWSANNGIDSNYVIASDGAVYLKTDTTLNTEDDLYYPKANTIPVLAVTDFYWGTPGPFTINPGRSLTTEPLEEGDVNTLILDGMVSATPLKGKKVARVLASDVSTNVRRDTANTIKMDNTNGLSDWFVPSKEELMNTIESGNTAFPQLNLSGKYWTSSETPSYVPEASLVTDDPAFTSIKFDIDIPDYWSTSVNFEGTTSISVIAKYAERFQTYNVRPARAF